MKQIAKLTIFKGRDPFTLPKTKVEWVKSSVPLVKVPVTRYKFMNSEVALILNGPDEEDVTNAANACLQEGAIKGIISGIVAGYASGGTAGVAAGIAAFASTVDSCMEARLGKALDTSVETENNSSWDNNWS